MQGNTEEQQPHSDINRYARPAGGDTFHITVTFVQAWGANFSQNFCILNAQMFVFAAPPRERGWGREPDCC